MVGKGTQRDKLVVLQCTVFGGKEAHDQVGCTELYSIIREAQDQVGCTELYSI